MSSVPKDRMERADSSFSLTMKDPEGLGSEGSLGWGPDREPQGWRLWVQATC